MLLSCGIAHRPLAARSFSRPPPRARRMTVAAAKLTGTVKWFNVRKGFGFITPDQGGQDIFVHQSNIKSDGFRSLRDGEPVEFELETDDNKRPKAVLVSGPNGANVQGAPRVEYENSGYTDRRGDGGYRRREYDDDY